MNLSRAKIIAFFIAIFILGWFLYPKELFLGYIFEGRKEAAQSEKYYLEHLKKHPYNKFATYRLAGTYERLAQPEKGVPLLEALYHRRKNDWGIAAFYLDFMENIGDEEVLHRLRLRVAHDFLKVPRFSKRKIESLLQLAMEYLLWHQRVEEALDILKQLIALSKDPGDYLYLLLDLDQGLKKTGEVIQLLEKRLAEYPEEEFLRIDLSLVYEANGQPQKAVEVLNKGLKLRRDSPALLKARAGLFKKHKQFDAAIREWEFLLSLKGFDAEERLDGLENLAVLYDEKHDWVKALGLYTEIWRLDPADPQHWQNVIFLHDKMGHLAEFVKGMKNYLEKFPEDAEMEKTLADALLYRLKDPAPFDFYLRHVHNRHVETFALDVADLYLKEKMKGEEERWLKAVFPLFADSIKVFSRTASFYERELRFQEAIHLCLGRMSSAPAGNFRPYVLAKLVHLYHAAGRLKESREILSQLQRQKISDPEILKMAGRELLAGDQGREGLRFFGEAQAARPKDVEASFLVMEAASALGLRVDVENAARRILALLETKKNRGAGEESWFLKARGRAGFDPSLRKKYEAARKKFPEDIDFFNDWVDLLLENKKFPEAAEEILLAELKFPNESRLWRSQKLRQAFLEKNWKEAIRVSRLLIREFPVLWTLRRDLAEAYQQDGQWQKAIAEYSALQKTHGDFAIFSAPLRELHALYDTRFTPEFRFIDYGAEERSEWLLTGRHFLSEKWELKGETQTGFYKSPSHAFNDDAEAGKILAGYSPDNRWTFRAGGGFGASPLRTVPSAFAGIHFRIPDRFKMGLEGDFNKLRTDLPAAVAGGAVVGRSELNAEYFLGRRLIFLWRYRFERSDIPGPAYALEHLVEPSMDWVLSKKPLLTLGYQYTFSHVLDRNNFLGPVPLVRRVRAHYLTGDFSRRLRRNFLWQGGFFIGEDTVRNLHFFAGDLMGLHSRITWNMTRGFDLEIGYDYGKETSTATSGRYQDMFLSLSAHY